MAEFSLASGYIDSVKGINTQALELPETLFILMKNVGAVNRRRALAKAAQYVRKVNRERIKANIEPDGTKMIRRKIKWGGRPPAMIFLYEDRHGQESLHLLATVSHNRALNRVGGSWQGTVADVEGKYFTGYDIAEGDVRTFRYDRVIKTFKRPPKSAFRMFREIGKRIKYKRQGEQFDIGFFGLDAKIASEHHFGNPDKKIPIRELLGLSFKDQEAVKNIILEHVLEGF